jgi:CheY-like chemotaxis protein
VKGESSYQYRTFDPLPALITVDLKLPRKSGFEVLEWLRKDPRFKDLPRVAIMSDVSPLISESIEPKVHRTGAFA